MTTNMKRMLSVILCIVLIAAVALFTIGCSNKTETENPMTDVANKDTDEQTDEKTTEENSETNQPSDTANTVGEGAKQFDFTVVDKNGNETKFIVKTDKKTVGEALLDAKLIEGEDGQYGLYVKKVNGIVADYDVDQTYWGFYVDGEMAMTGVDSTNIEEGKVYSFKVSK